MMVVWIPAGVYPVPEIQGFAKISMSSLQQFMKK